MKRRVGLLLLALLLAVSFSTSGSIPALAQGPQGKWKLVNPEGSVVLKPVEIAPRISTLEGKTVALYWNGKHNGDNFLNRVAELLKEKVKGVKIVKVYETNPETSNISGSPEKSKAKVPAILKSKPDLVIGSSAD